MEEYSDYKRDRRSFIQCFCGLFIIIIIFMIMFIVAVVLSTTTIAPKPCPNIIAIICQFDIHYVYQNGQRTNDSFVNIEYLVENKIYKNTTTLTLINQYNLKEIAAQKGAIYVYKECSNQNQGQYYLGPTYMNIANPWIAVAAIFGFLFVILIISMSLSCLGLCLSNKGYFG